jgi:cysteinyl-tRNA synthetase
MDVFGVDDLAQEALEDDAIQSLIDERDAARAARDFASSDEIREELAAQNILLEDTPQGTRWRRATQD